MGFRFQKRIKIAPGVRLNLSKSGVSTSLGGKGASLNFNSKGTRATIGIPGSGLSWSKQIPNKTSSPTTKAQHLQNLAKFLELVANEFNKLSPKANKATENWRKAVESFEGGRGPTHSKFITLNKRYETALRVYDETASTAQEISEALDAFREELSRLKLGWLEGHLKNIKSDLDNEAFLYQKVMPEFPKELSRVRERVVDEFRNLESKLQSD